MVRHRWAVQVTLSVGDEVLLRYRGRTKGSQALTHALKKANPPEEPVQSWAGLTKRRAR